MSLLVKMTLSAALVLSIGVPFGAFAAGEKTKGRYKTALGVNVFLFFGTMIAAAAFMFSGNAFAAEETAAAASNSAAGMGYLSAALATGLSCLGGGIAVSAAASAALAPVAPEMMPQISPTTSLQMLDTFSALRDIQTASSAPRTLCAAME